METMESTDQRNQFLELGRELFVTFYYKRGYILNAIRRASAGCTKTVPFRCVSHRHDRTATALPSAAGPFGKTS